MLIECLRHLISVPYNWRVKPKREPSFLAIARERKELSQDDVAAKLGVTQATVSHWETGAHPPHPTMLRPISKVYGVSVTRLLAFFYEAA